jgi:hypothetical protein
MVLLWHQGKILHPKITKELFEVLEEAGYIFDLAPS